MCCVCASIFYWQGQHRCFVTIKHSSFAPSLPYSSLLSTLFRSACFSYGDGDLLRECRGGFAPALRDSVWCAVRWMGIRQGGMKR